ncbi:MAG: PspA/IM30 family protein [Pseudomonadota bacterium]
MFISAVTAISVLADPAISTVDKEKIMWKTLRTIMLGRSARAEEKLEIDHAPIILEQKIREAEAGHNEAKRALAHAIAQAKRERATLTGLEKRIADLTDRIRTALAQQKENLAEDAARLLADLENEHSVRTRTLKGAEERAERLRLAIEKTDRRLIDLRQGLLTATSIDTERRATNTIKGTLTANTAIAEGEAVLNRLMNSEDPVAEIEALEAIESDLSGASVIDAMAKAGIGEGNQTRPEDVLTRIKASMSVQVADMIDKADTAFHQSIDKAVETAFDHAASAVAPKPHSS